MDQGQVQQKTEKKLKLTTETVGIEFSLTVKSGDNYIKATAHRFSTIGDEESESEAFDRCKQICVEQVQGIIEEMA